MTEGVTRPRRASIWRILALLLGTFALVFLLAAGWVIYKMQEAPGEGPRAERAKELGGLAATALESWRNRHGEYPGALSDLRDTPPMTAELIDEMTRTGPVTFDYRGIGTRYELSFRYTGPGMNYCNYVTEPSERPLWDCGGYY